MWLNNETFGKIFLSKKTDEDFPLYKYCVNLYCQPYSPRGFQDIEY